MDKKKSIPVGIDLGTTFCSIAYINEETNKAEIIPSNDQERIIPSVVLFEDENNIIVGKIAKQNAVSESDSVVEFVKRQIGKPKEDERDEKGAVCMQGWHYEYKGKKYSAQEISAMILKKLKNDAEARLGAPVTDVVITCPAYFGNRERVATKESGRIAGLNVLAILDEPVASALSFGLEKKRKDQNVFVFDLGGGTLDVVILEIKEDKIQEITIDGDHMLGGKDWDDEVIKYVSALFMERHGSDPLDDPASYQDLQLSAIKAKEELSRRERTKIMVHYGGNSMGVELTRNKFEEITKSLVERCSMCCEKVLLNAHMTWREIDTLLLVGGSSRMPAIERMVAEISDKEPNKELNPDECVALGAAWHASILGFHEGSSDIKKQIHQKVRTVTARNLGIITLDSRGTERNESMIDKSTPLPYKKTKTFETAVDNQKSLLISIMEGGIMKDDGTCDPDDSNKIAVGKIVGIPPLPKGSPVEVTYKYNDDGMFEAYVKHVATNKDLKMTLIHNSGLTHKEIKEAKKYIDMVQITG